MSLRANLAKRKDDKDASQEIPDDSASSISLSVSEIAEIGQIVPTSPPVAVNRMRHKRFVSAQSERSLRRVSIGTLDGTGALLKLPPKPAKADVGRTISTTVRLSRQGFRSRASESENFAVRSIRRGSEGWHRLIKPFCADIVFQSLQHRRHQSEVSFVPYTCHAAVLFIDLSGYSKISAAIADKGAHVLSSIVNSYLSRILQIVHTHGGDVVKFAGDAVLVLWQGRRQQLSVNVQCAARCAIEIQEKARSHPVDPSRGLVFRNHIGLCCGGIESEVFEAPTHVNMQKRYHSLGGEALNEISDVVDMAKAGEICVATSCTRYFDGLAEFDQICPSKQNCLTEGLLLKSLTFDDELKSKLDAHIESSLMNRMLNRTMLVEEDFIHPNVLRQLSHGGHDPTQIAQMRNLCVIFIAMTSSGSSVNWLMEVQGVLDRHRCPIVQIIDDDKGVHLVAAVNLYEAIPEASLMGLDVAKDLLDKHVGCAIGVAMGATFCGVTGSASVACRWDITGPPAVRAARLMQFCLTEEEIVAIDQSVYNDPVASVRLCLLHPGITIKGTDGLCPVYKLSHSTAFHAFRVLETVHGAVHDDVVRKIQQLISGDKSRSAVVVTGPTLSGKKIVCQRAAGYSDLVPYLHVCEENGDHLQLARTMATWYKYVDHGEVQRRATNVLEFLDLQHWTRAHDECVRLVTYTLENGISSCFLVDRIQFLDEFSFSLIRECLHGRVKVNRLAMSSRSSLGRKASDGISLFSSETSFSSNESGSLSFLCVHVPLYNWMDASEVVSHVTRAHRNLDVAIVEVTQATKDELRVMMRDLSDMKVDDRWLDTYAESSGYCAGYLVERSAATRTLSAKLWSEGKPGFAVTTEQVELHIPPGLVGMNKQLKVHQTTPEVVMRFTQAYDELPPLFQTVCKVLSIATRRKFFSLPKAILWEVLNDLVAEGIELDLLETVLAEMEEMFLVVEKTEKEPVVAFLNPAFADIVSDVCTPIQVESMVDALIDRLWPIADRDFRIPLVIATLSGMAKKQKDDQSAMWKRGFQAFQSEQESLSSDQRLYWLELMQDEITGAGFDVGVILGGDFCCYIPHKRAISSVLPMLKIYQGPISMGEMSHALSVLFANTFHEHANFFAPTKSQKCRLSRANHSASARYLRQMQHVETYLAKHGLKASVADTHREREIIQFVARQATSPEEVVSKADQVLNEFVPHHIENRMERMRALVEKFRRERRTPDVIAEAEPAIRLAYESLQSNQDRTDAAQDALMTLATHNWKPEPVPEHMCIIYQQTVARIRNKVLKRLTPAQLIGFRHQQNVEDLEAFLIVTPLLRQLGKEDF